MEECVNDEYGNEKQKTAVNKNEEGIHRDITENEKRN